MKIIFILILFISASANAQLTKKYYEKLNANGTIDSGYVKIFTDSVFQYSDNTFVSFTVEHYQYIFGAVMPNQFGNFHLDADGIYRNKTPRAEAVDWDGVGNKPSTFTATASTVGTNLLAIANPASPSLVRINTNGSVAIRTAAEAKQDLSIENVDNTSDANKPVSSATTTALNLKANLASPTFTGTVSGITAAMVGLGNVNNTSDASKPVSTAQQTALDGKQATLVSNTNIKTVNGGTVLGSGDIVTTRKVAQADIASTASATSTTTLFTPSADGFYRVAIYLKITTTGTSPVAGPVTITYTSADGSVAQSHVMLLQSVTGTVVTTTVNNSTTTGTVNGTMVIYAKAGVAIQYAIAVSGTFGAGRYMAHLFCEQL